MATEKQKTAWQNLGRAGQAYWDRILINQLRFCVAGLLMIDVLLFVLIMTK